jgi:hypothetical protein
MIAEPQPVAFEARRRRQPLDMQDRKPIAKARQVVLERAERDELQLLARALDDRAPAMRMAVGVDVQPAALLTQVEAEARIEPAGILGVRHREIELVERVHAEFPRAAGQRLRQRSDLRHRTPP